MSSHAKAAGAVLSLGILAACGGGGGGGSAQIAPPNSFTLGTAGKVTESRADISRSSDGRIVLNMTEGDMAGMTVLCEDQTMGRCQVVGGPAGTSAEGTLLQRMAGSYAFVGNFAVLQLVNGTLVSNNQLAHGALPETASITPTLPAGQASYTGAFEAGFGLESGESGLMAGNAQLIANFNTGQLSGAFSGATESGTGINASFNNITISATNGEFTSNDDTLILFQGAEAGGDIHGAFYGPNADEAAGIFNFGNAAGGMSGVFLTCHGNTATCLE
ncbi:transferrin-binding protein-like solute binding protein [Roseinatronobacter sp.]|uniref:transferrin-binding protein-like solute binding protein n=1 Tax=Roseinatronobacter sp. TaxID=1945755 RepID=UPI0025F22D9D|nr:transferrin-binding protein-like solute binding protein [Roseibaca sp.]